MKMKFTVAALCLAAFGTMAQTDGISGTIEAQMQAFREGDVAEAFTYASPNLRALFGSPEVFGGMVQRGYPMVWQPGKVELLERRNVAGGLWQRVRVTDAAGRGHLLDYQMVETPEGWRINAVQVLPEPDLSA